MSWLGMTEYGAQGGSLRGRHSYKKQTMTPNGEENFMTVYPVLQILWAVLATSFFALLLYRGHLSRYEDEQLFLSDAASTAQQKHSAIVRKVTKIEPIVRAIGGAATIVSLCAVAVYVWGAWQQIS